MAMGTPVSTRWPRQPENAKFLIRRWVRIPTRYQSDGANAFSRLWVRGLAVTCRWEALFVSLRGPEGPGPVTVHQPAGVAGQVVTPGAMGEHDGKQYS